jgi:predicted glycosyltransferase
MRIVFLCCHLTGTGHFVRTIALARAALRLGHQATVISGGRPLEHVEANVPLVQLPPVTVRDLEFTRLRTPGGESVPAEYMERRHRALGEALAAARPEALVTELYPFGRQALAGEFIHAITAARAGDAACAIVCSVRDIPEPKPHRIAETAACLAREFDGVLVHGDPDFLPLATTWPLPAELAVMIHHTGYVGTEIPAPTGQRRDDVLVATGGGVLGRGLVEVAAAGAALSTRPWHLLVGGSDADGRIAALQASAPPNLTVQRARPDYRALLAAAGCSVSLCGYNTAVELARCRTPAILVPSEEADEREQLIRARRLAEHRGFRLLRMSELTPEALAEAAEAFAAEPERPPLPLAGDDGTAAIETLAAIAAAKAGR